MLAWAGTSYAMANAHPEVLDIATHVLPSNDDEGVADLIDSVLAEHARGFSA
jgi:hydroxymethylpyrimidine pyrophosphatase-like HAD family hydrolase